MPTNLEIKARCPDPERIRATGEGLAGVLTADLHQTDTFLATDGGRLKVRADETGRSLIAYRRPASPLPKQNDYEVTPLTEEEAAARIERAERRGEVRRVVTKRRRLYAAGSVRVHLDAVEGLGDFCELEIDVGKVGGEQAARERAAELLAQMGIADADLIPWSYAELLAMKSEAGAWRARLAGAEAPGRLFLLDGASCSGKTTLVERLREGDPSLSYVPRYCTREPRPGEKNGGEYLFVSHARFGELAEAGAFVEYRDFEFGMSYGLAWEDCLTPVLAGGNALGVINLGSGRHVKELLPEAVLVLIDPPLETIRRRLVARGINKPHEIEERVGNARRVSGYRRYYDRVLPNDDGQLDATFAELMRIVSG